MSVINDNYLYYDYCSSPLPPPMAYGRARQLATRIGVPEDMDVCDGLNEKICHVSVDDCANASYDNVVVQCGASKVCRSAGHILDEWALDPKAQERFSPLHRDLVKKTFKSRGTPKARARLTCAERRGNQKLCEDSTLCEHVLHNGDCKAKVSSVCIPTTSRFLLLDAVLRTIENPSGNMRRKLEQNIEDMSDTSVCNALAGFHPKTKAKANNQINSMASSILGESDTLDAQTLQHIAERIDIELPASQAALLTSAFNAISAAVSIQAPWWFYFIVYPSGRDALQNVLSDSVSGQLFKLSLLMTGMKGNWIFEDKLGLLDHVHILDSKPIVKTLASALTGILLRKLSATLKKKNL